MARAPHNGKPGNRAVNDRDKALTFCRELWSCLVLTATGRLWVVSVHLEIPGAKNNNIRARAKFRCTLFAR